MVGRFSPSPTGKLHLGSLRTALISYITSSQFVLRIEDTDVKRSTKESEDEILESFKWLNIKYDGAVVKQSEQEKAGVYKDLVATLVAEGYAYYCNCSVADLKEMKLQQIKNKERRLGYIGVCRDQHHTSGVVRLNARKIGEDHINKFFTFDDDVYGHRKTDFRDTPDAILLRADGTATYILANTVDDMLANVNYIARGADIITQTPIQVALRIAIHHATGMPLPKVRYAHLPLILGANKEKLSKRNEDTKSILDYKQQGVMKEAIMQFVLSLGNNSVPTDKALSFDELKACYDVTKLHRNDTAFLEHKLLHMNSLHIRKSDGKALQMQIKELYNVDIKPALLDIYKYRVKTLVELKNICTDISNMLSTHSSKVTTLQNKQYSVDACKQFRLEVLNGMATPPLDALLQA